MGNFSISGKIEEVKRMIRNMDNLIAVGRDLASLSEAQRLLTGKVIVNQIKSHGVYGNIQDAEFKVFSQFGDDGIIQYLINYAKVLPGERRFVEFGVEDYRESNTRFLLMNDNWSGLVMDGSEKNVEKIVTDSNFWRYDLTALPRFIKKDNIRGILKESGFDKDIGLMHVDIDGNDYWIWKAIENIRPVILIAEYNSILGDKHAVTIPYEPDFYRTKAHFSNLYWGASLKAYYGLFTKRGYKFVGTNSAGNNAYFVRKDRLGKVKAVSLAEGYTESKYRESRDRKGNLTYIRGRERMKAIGDKLIFSLEKGRLTRIKDLYKL